MTFTFLKNNLVIVCHEGFMFLNFTFDIFVLVFFKMIMSGINVFNFASSLIY